MSAPDNAALAAMVAARSEAERQAANLKTQMDALTDQHEVFASQRTVWLQSVGQLSAAIDRMSA